MYHTLPRSAKVWLESSCSAMPWLLSSWYLYVQQNLLETLDQGPDFYLWNLVSFFRNHFQDRWIAKKKKVMTWYLCRFNTDIIFLPIWFVHLHNLMLNVALRLLFDGCSVLFYDVKKEGSCWLGQSLMFQLFQGILFRADLLLGMDDG